MTPQYVPIAPDIDDWQNIIHCLFMACRHLTIDIVTLHETSLEQRVEIYKSFSKTTTTPWTKYFHCHFWFTRTFRWGQTYDPVDQTPTRKKKSYFRFSIVLYSKEYSACKVLRNKIIGIIFVPAYVQRNRHLNMSRMLRVNASP